MVRLSFQIIKNTEVPSLILLCDNQRYFFNVPETFQRFYREHRIKMTQGPVFFFTRSSTETVSGIIGMMLTLFQEQFSVNSKMYGPSKIGDILSVLRYNEVGGFKTLPFSYYDLENSKTSILGIKQLKIIDDILLKTNNCSFDESLENIKKLDIEKDVEIANQNNAQNSIINGQYEDQNVIIIPIRLINAQDLNQEEAKDSSSQLSCFQYAVVSKKQPGKVLQEKLQEYKIEKSKLGTLFKQGYLQMSDGVIVTEKDVRSPDINPTLILILDIRSEEQILQLQSQVEFINLMKQVSDKSITMQAIVHLSNAQVITTDKYQQFLHEFSNYHNLLCNFQQETQCESEVFHQGFIPRSMQICKEFNLHFPNNFPQIKVQSLPKITFLKDNQNLLGYFPLYEYIILPFKDQPYGPVQNLESDQIFKTFKPNEEALNQISLVQYQQQSKDDRKLIFLGTGSMKPGKYRNVSSNLITTSRSNILLDCGEGTWKQVQDQQIDIINKPLIIWISHVHSDHHLGILNLMSQYINKSVQPNIYVLIPALMLPWVYHYERLIPSFSQAKFVPIQYFTETQTDVQKLISKAFLSQRIRNNPNACVDEPALEHLYGSTLNNYNQLKQQLGEHFEVKEISPVTVEHCPEAFGISITWTDGFKISYSGDTRPCKNFSDCSKNADIMIHEATFSDDLQDNAIQNMHSTIREAVELAIESNSKNLALTHFSQRFSKSGINQNTKSVQSTKGIANKYTDEQYSQYLNNKSVYAVDHFGGYIDQFQQLTTISQIVGKLLPEDE